jgi:hypothetical protein
MTVKPAYFLPKHTGEVERRAIDWTSALPAGDSITASAWSVTPAGLTLSGQALAGAVASIQVAAGISGTTHQVQNTVTTAQGFTLIEIVPLSVF